MNEGGVILYPTDTVWGIGCDATNEEAVRRVYEIKKRADSKAMLVLVDSPVKVDFYVQDVPAVIPVIDVVETVRHLTGNSSETVSRNDYKLVQTPQVFDTELLKRAYTQEFTPFFTDDASVVEAMGVPVYLAEGNRENIKITTPFDLKIGSALL